MSDVPILSLLEEAEDCRRRALAYVGRPEAPFLLRVADALEKVSQEQRDQRLRSA